MVRLSSGWKHLRQNAVTWLKFGSRKRKSRSATPEKARLKTFAHRKVSALSYSKKGVFFPESNGKTKVANFQDFGEKWQVRGNENYKYSKILPWCSSGHPLQCSTVLLSQFRLLCICSSDLWSKLRNQSLRLFLRSLQISWWYCRSSLASTRARTWPCTIFVVGDP